jgi:hypothetical protein
MGPFTHTWMLPSRMEQNSAMWLLQVNGLFVDIRDAPIDLQRLAFEKGLIPYVPADKVNL